MIQLDTNIIFWFVLSTFTLGASVLAVATLANVFRLRNVRLSWKAGKLKGYPLFATFFLIVVIVVGGISIYESSFENMIASGLYFSLGLCWFTTSYFAAKCFITDHGIVKNVNEPSQTVAWHQIRDFVEKEQGTHYVFFYYQNEETRLGNLVRLEITVPPRKKDSFQNLISHKLGRRIRCYTSTDSDINVEQFKR